MSNTTAAKLKIHDRILWFSDEVVIVEECRKTDLRTSRPFFLKLRRANGRFITWWGKPTDKIRRAPK